MAQHRVLTAAEYGRDALAMQGDPRIPYGVDATEDRMKPACSEGVPQRSVRISQLAQLTDGDYAVLPSRQLGQPVVTSPFSMHTDQQGRSQLSSSPRVALDVGEMRTLRGIGGNICSSA